MNAHGSRCFHDAVACGIDLSVDAGIADPALACFYPDLLLADECPRICILRPDWCEAMEAWIGTKVPDAVATLSNANCDRFAQADDTYTVAFESLEDNGQIEEIVKLCTGKPASLEIIQIFQGLQIEQHRRKFQSFYATSP